MPLSGHAAVETYAVITRLPAGIRLSAADAVGLIEDRFVDVLTLSAPPECRLHAELADRGVVGGSTDDALVAAAARENDAVLATRDARARSTYELLGTEALVVGPTSGR